MNKYRAIQTIALRDVLKQSPEANLNFIFRWFSREFSTPLPEVEDLPLEYVLQHYYEDTYAHMSKEDIAKEREDLQLTEEESNLKIKQDDDFMEIIEKAPKTLPNKTKIAPSVKNLHQLKDLEKALEQFKEIKVDFD